jgi:hypothetical protein
MLDWQWTVCLTGGGGGQEGDFSRLNRNHLGGFITGYTSYLNIFTYPEGYSVQYSAICPLRIIQTFAKNLIFVEFAERRLGEKPVNLKG